MLKFLAVVLAVCFVQNSNAISFLKHHQNKQANKNIRGEQLKLQGSEEAWFQQKLDNFSPRDSRTWYQRYFVNDEYSKSDGAVFLQIGGEGPASPAWMRNGHWIEMAKKVGALCFQLEHRFYGLSKPTKDVSLSNLTYLSSQQALSDLSMFISAMNDKHSLHNRKWIVFGGSYPGSLALWAKLKFPHLITGAVSASAPLNAQLDFSAYNEVVERSLNTLGDPTCSSRVSMATEYLAELINSGKNSEIAEYFPYLCKDLTSYDYEYFQQSLADSVAEVVQYNRDNRGFEATSGKKHHVMNITGLCAVMRETEMKPQLMLNAYAKIGKMMLEQNGIECFDASYATYINDMRNSSWSAAPASREWVYQTCTEFGWYQTTTTTSSQPFRGFPLSFFERECALLFNVDRRELREAVKRTNVMYGDTKKLIGQLNSATLYNGLVDPWSNVSYVGQFGKSDFPIEVVADTAHCAIMYPSNELTDSKGLTAARLQVEKQLFGWLGLK